uniref:Reverse transcriptase domain-containing protein n=1 Tax=Trichogramma kaykai TaxID=54128 RepID=A0ABD2VWM3_9HYME
MHDLGAMIVERGVDFALLQEPWTYGSDPVGLPSSLRRFSSTSGKAAVIVANDKIDCMIIDNLTSENGVCVWMGCEWGSFYVVSLYCQFGREIEVDVDYLDGVLDGTSDSNLIIATDANACSRMWFSKSSRGHFRGVAGKRGAVLEEFILIRDLEILNQPSQVFTFSGPRGESDIDLTMVRGWGSADWHWEVRDDCGLSDHNPIFVSATLQGLSAKKAMECSSAFVMKASRLKSVAAYVGYKAEQLGFGAFWSLTADEKVEAMEGWINEGCQEFLDLRKKRGKSIKWWSQKLQRLKKTAGQSRRVYQKARKLAAPDLPDKLASFKRCVKAYKAELCKAKTLDWHKFVRENNRDPWSMVYRICSGKKGSADIARIRRADKQASNWLDSATLLLEEFFPEDRPVGATVRFSHADYDSEWLWSEVNRAVVSLRTGKAPGPDGFPSELIKEIWKTLPYYFKELMDCSLRTGVFPSRWKMARIVVLFKGGNKDPSKARSYRPISLLNTMAKVLECMLVRRLNIRMDNEWCDAQYGFRQGRSTEDLLCRLRNLVDHSSAKLVAGVLVDFRGAFDFLSWHSTLDRLDLVGLSSEEMGLWSSYFADRSVFLMNRRGGQVARRGLERGCPQGSIGGPTVWNLALDELLWQLERAGIPVVAYADDTTCLAEGESRDQLEASVQRAFGFIYDWCDKYGVSVSEEKTQIILLRGKLDTSGRRVKVVRGNDVRKISYVNEAKLLGCTIGVRFNYACHVNALREKVISRLGGLKRVLKKEWGVKGCVCNTWIKGIFEATALYGAGAWGDALRYSTLCDEIVRCQRAVLSACLRVCRTVPTEAMQVLAGSPPWDLECLRRRTVYKIKKGLDLDEWDFVSRDGSSNDALINRCNRELFVRWQDRWDTSQKGRATYGFLPNVSRALKVRDSVDIGWLEGYIVTGHGAFRGYLKKHGKQISPNCSCGAVEDWEHVLVECNIYEDLREACGLRFNLSLSGSERYSTLFDDEGKYEALRAFLLLVFERRKEFDLAV